jgi:hypothetical protein
MLVVYRRGGGGVSNCVAKAFTDISAEHTDSVFRLTAPGSGGWWSVEGLCRVYRKLGGKFRPVRVLEGQNYVIVSCITDKFLSTNSLTSSDTDNLKTEAVGSSETSQITFLIWHGKPKKAAI